MRLWSISPEHLDQKGLIAAWREALLAQKVLEGKTKGYKNHPQLNRFKNSKHSIQSIGFFLKQIWKEAEKRGYVFDKNKIKIDIVTIEKIKVTKGQIEYERIFLKEKIKKRDDNKYKEIALLQYPQVHELFVIHEGAIEEREKIKS